MVEHSVLKGLQFGKLFLKDTKKLNESMSILMMDGLRVECVYK